MLRFNESGTISEFSSGVKNAGKHIGFIPTMGALHDGHLSLIAKAKQENDIVVCSIFVNPTQFNNSEDFKNYPIDIEEDIKKLAEVGCDAVFVPSVKEMYPENLTTINIDVGGIDKFLEGEHRPGHFDGVITIVNKLFNAVKPNKAYFGQKDFQQYRIIKKMAETLNNDVEIVMCPTKRESDGLAMSSRNRLLSTHERMLAPLIYRTLENAIKASPEKEISELLLQMREDLKKEKEIIIDYIEIADINTLEPISFWESIKESQAFIAAFLGKIRLIDNVTLVRGSF